jgi:hypothetical protein
MSMTYSSSTASSDVASYGGGFADALGDIATIVLAIIALAGVKPEILVATATVVFGAALLIQGGAMLTEFALIEEPEAESASTGGGFDTAFDLIEQPGTAPLLTSQSDILRKDPQLGALANNGGPTMTVDLLAGSPAIDQGSTAFVTAGETDPRGMPRIVNGTVDIGAVEYP